MRASSQGIHISGAERIVPVSQVNQVVNSLVERAFSHSRGSADSISIKLEEIKEKPENIPSLRVFEISDRKKYSIEDIVSKLFLKVGIDRDTSLKVYRTLLSGPSPDGNVMRGAMIVEMETGKRLEPDSFRGVRATYMDFTESALRSFKEATGKNFTENFKEAVVLSSKVLNCKGIVAEMCISDDPNYTTGYVSLKGLGYVRIHKMKAKGCPFGGRAFFVEKETDVKKVINYLERKPVLIDRFSGYTLASFMEILSF